MEEYKFLFDLGVPLSWEPSFDLALIFARSSITCPLAFLYNLPSQLFCLVSHFIVLSCTWLLIVLLDSLMNLASVRLNSVWRLPCRADTAQIYHVIINLSDVSKIQYDLVTAIIAINFSLRITLFLVFLLVRRIFAEHTPHYQSDKGDKYHKENDYSYCDWWTWIANSLRRFIVLLNWWC